MVICLGGLGRLVGGRVDNPPQVDNLPHISTALRELYPQIYFLFLFAFWYSVPHEPKTANL